MKIGMLISLAVTILLAGAVVMFMRGSADVPTGDTRGPDALVKLTLGESLPPVFEPRNMDAEAGPLYQQAIDYFQEHERQLSGRNPDPQHAAALADLLIEAMHAGRVRRHFLDEQVPLEPGIHKDLAHTLSSMGTAVFRHAEAIHEEDADRALEASLSVWALGQRSFEDNILFEIRSSGIANMMGSVNQVMWWQERFPEQFATMDRWAEEATRLDVRWRSKGQIIRTLRPKIGDVLRLAAHDEDPTFRVMAIQRLGMLRFNPGHAANLRAIESALEQFQRESDPYIAKAAARAASLTIEEYRAMRL